MLDPLERTINGGMWVQSVRALYYFQMQCLPVLLLVSRGWQVKLRPEMCLCPFRAPEVFSFIKCLPALHRKYKIHTQIPTNQTPKLRIRVKLFVIKRLS